MGRASSEALEKWIVESVMALNNPDNDIAAQYHWSLKRLAYIVGAGKDSEQWLTWYARMMDAWQTDAQRISGNVMRRSNARLTSNLADTLESMKRISRISSISSAYDELPF